MWTPLRLFDRGFYGEKYFDRRTDATCEKFAIAFNRYLLSNNHFLRSDSDNFSMAYRNIVRGISCE
jgi:hypothetical protein